MSPKGIPKNTEQNLADDHTYGQGAFYYIAFATRDCIVSVFEVDISKDWNNCMIQLA